MQIYAINGSPRKKWNTATILQHILDGAAEEDENVLTEMINLYDYHYQGCMSCFQCKRIDGKYYGRCAIHDDIEPVMQNILNADMAVFGSPIYFGDITGMMRSFLERLFFPNFVYDSNYSSLAPKKLFSAFIYTMNVPHAGMIEHHYPDRLSLMENFAAHLFGHKPQVMYVNNTYQFSDYSKYKMEIFSEREKAEWRKEHFPIDCENAKKLGGQLVQAALESRQKQ